MPKQGVPYFQCEDRGTFSQTSRKKNIVSQKENDSFPATEPKDMVYCNLMDKEFKTAAMKKFNELQENSGNTMTSEI